MYCSTCGVAVAQGLSYCNYCGAKLSGDGVTKPSEVRAEFLVFAMIAVFVFGLVAITMFMGVMRAALGLQVETILVFTLLPILLMLVLEGVFIRLLLTRNRGAGITDESARLREQTTRELDAKQARALPEPLASVTEHTTRTFDPIYRERESK